MECHGCKVRKPPNEFPSMRLTNKCRHPRYFCMRCVVREVAESGRDECPRCYASLEADSQVIEILQATLDEMFREYSCEYTPLVVAGGDMLRVSILTGDSALIHYRPDLTILEVKDTILKRFKHDHSKQKLVYNDKKLEVYGRSHKKMTLEDYGIEANATVHLLVLLYAIPDDLDHVIFDLNWGYPAGSTDNEVDYLDASCFAFRKEIYVSVCDFMHDSKGKSEKKSRFNAMRHYRSNPDCEAAIMHSGDRMDDEQRRGHHTIDVHMKKIPTDITHLIFTLSAFKAPTVSKFPSPALQFYEAKNSDADLCSTSLERQINNRAVIMCSVAKDEDGKWQIFECGAETDGCAAGYLKIVATIKKLMKKGILG